MINNLYHSPVFTHSQQLLKKLFEKAHVDDTHGLAHSLQVTTHAYYSLLELTISAEQKQDIILASLLHDADDKKYFPKHQQYQNCYSILSKVGISTTRTHSITSMIDAVSFSKNGDAISHTNHSFYIPRYSDRLQAIGNKGIIRSYQYTLHKNQSLVTQHTIKPTSQSQLWKLVDGRDKQYIRNGGNSQSFIDHIYDKLIHIKLPISNQYLQQAYHQSQQDVIHFALHCAKHNYNNIPQAIQQLQAQVKL